MPFFSPFPGKWRLSTDKGENFVFLYAVWVQYLAKTQIYCGKKVIAELTRDSDSLASIQETLKNVVLHITSRKMHANVDVLLKTVKLLICWVYRRAFGFSNLLLKFMPWNYLLHSMSEIIFKAVSHWWGGCGENDTSGSLECFSWEHRDSGRGSVQLSEQSLSTGPIFFLHCVFPPSKCWPHHRVGGSLSVGSCERCGSRALCGAQGSPKAL